MRSLTLRPEMRRKSGCHWSMILVTKASACSVEVFRYLPSQSAA